MPNTQHFFIFDISKIQQRIKTTKLMNQKFLLLVLVSIFFIQCDAPVKKIGTHPNNKATQEKSKNLKLVWSDEFDTDGLPDPNKWTYDTGDGCPDLCGWGNNELQYYTSNRSENARVENGHLIIEAIKEDFKTRKYSSARLVSKGKGEWKYGVMEIKAKLPSGRGTWPAIWMLPVDWKYGNWPKSGEIDIMEHVGYSPDSVYGTVHTGSYNHMYGTHRSGHVVNDKIEEGFHIYKIDWTEEQIEFSVDGKSYFTFENEHNTTEEWPFDQSFYLIMNIAVGGNWGGKKGVDETIWPQKLEVDYVRVYQ